MDGFITTIGIGMFVVLALVTVGGPVAVADWVRQRRQRTTELQIALTDAIDARLGTIVSPVVRRRLLAPWEISIAVPVQASEATGRILAIVDRVISDLDGTGPAAYRVVLTPRQDRDRAMDDPRGGLSPEPWSRRPMGVA